MTQEKTLQALHSENERLGLYKDAYAQPEQEPVAWVSEDVCKGQYIDGRPRKIWWECEKGVGTAFYTHPPQRTEQEPVTWGVDWGKAGDISCVSIIKRLPNGGIEVMAVEYAPYSYTTPPQRIWQGLTNEEVESYWDWEDFQCGCGRGTLLEMVLDIQVKLKERNT